MCPENGVQCTKGRVRKMGYISILTDNSKNGPLHQKALFESQQRSRLKELSVTKLVHGLQIRLFYHICDDRVNIQSGAI